MSTILAGVSSLVASAPSWVQSFLNLLFTYREVEDPSRGETMISGISWVGLFVVVLPLVGLGIGLIRRLVRIRA